MDDAPRAGILKTAIVVSLLVVVGAGCAKRTPEVPLNSEQAVTPNVTPPETLKSDFVSRICFNNTYKDLSVDNVVHQIQLATGLTIDSEEVDVLLNDEKDGWKFAIVCADRVGGQMLIGFSWQKTGQMTADEIKKAAFIFPRNEKPSPGQIGSGGFGEFRVGFMDNEVSSTLRISDPVFIDGGSEAVGSVYDLRFENSNDVDHVIVKTGGSEVESSSWWETLDFNSQTSVLKKIEACESIPASENIGGAATGPNANIFSTNCY